MKQALFDLLSLAQQLQNARKQDGQLAAALRHLNAYYPCQGRLIRYMAVAI